MTGVDESREEVSTLTAAFMTPKQPPRIGFWNVRTLYPAGKLVQTINEMNNYALELLVIAEARWTKTGKQRLSTGETIIWSERQDDNHQEGVTLILSEKHANSIIRWEPINERLLYDRLNSKYTKTSIVVGYVPTGVTENVED
ncbi:craniofacial development protein 2-like [Elysia marginata]|uniref:Craniofacial development protein 2-like n=1 Tax=Elysia marginata TaxID=1093978 RepID=A0AAV4FKZ3_9GAST|nr:craniofacial development protein 2-like [Elysia marginata]